MKRNNARTVLLGDLIVEAFDEAALHSDDSAEVSRLAVQTVVDMLGRAGRHELGLREAVGSKREPGL